MLPLGDHQCPPHTEHDAWYTRGNARWMRVDSVSDLGPPLIPCGPIFLLSAPTAGILCGAVPGKGCHLDRACEYLWGEKAGLRPCGSDSFLPRLPQVIRGLLKYWPKTCTQKEVGKGFDDHRVGVGG